MKTASLIARLSLGAILVGGSTLAQENELTLWYAAPAVDWEREALPIGNGASGAMIFGGVERDQVQFNEKTLWTGGPRAQEGYDFGVPAQSTAEAVGEVAALLDEHAQLAPEEVARRLGRKARGYGDYQSFGTVTFEFPSPVTPVSNYRRELDLHDAIARVRYERDGVQYTR
jgi:alpha-L-fucosidase 2